MKEKDKILIAKLLLKITFIMLFLSLALKLVGLNWFELSSDNKILFYLSRFVSQKLVKIILDRVLLFIQAFIFLRLCSKNNNQKLYYMASIAIVAITTFFQFFIWDKFNFNENVLMLIYYLITFGLLIVAPLLIDWKLKIFSKTLQKTLFWLLVITIYQLTVMFIRNITYVKIYDNLYNFLLNFDYMILLIFTYYLFLKKELNSSLDIFSHINLQTLFNSVSSLEESEIFIFKLKEKIEKFKKMTRYEKAVLIIYLLFFVLSECINLALIIFVAYLNHALVECFFIVISFLISRKIFGSFHLDSAIKCWLVSNLSFFILNKISLSVSITLVVPCFLGLSLSYLTSRFIKQPTKQIYRGMKEQELIGLFKDKKLSLLEQNILKDFYVNRESIVKLTYKYNYSRTMIFEFKAKALKKIEI